MPVVPATGERLLDPKRWRPALARSQDPVSKYKKPLHQKNLSLAIPVEHSLMFHAVTSLFKKLTITNSINSIYCY
jgi:hypothetical protein